MLAGNIPGETQTMPMAIYFAVEAGDLQEAWLWAIVIMAISLSGLLAVNLWQQRYEHKRQGQPELIEADEPVDRGGKQTPVAALGQRTQPPLMETSTGLLVDFKQQRSRFTLNTAFTARQETLGILGGSGSGKSMTLRCIAGVETPTSGRIVLNGRILFDADKRINLPSHQRNVGLVFQNYALFPHMTIAQNIAFGLHKRPRALRRQHVAAQLALV